jgi:hypothetical protein
MKEQNEIDDFFKQALSDYVPPSGKTRMSSALWIRIFFLTAFNKVLFAVLFVGMILGGTLLYQSYFNNSEQTPVNTSDTLSDSPNNREPGYILPEHSTTPKIEEKTTISIHPEVSEKIDTEEQSLFARDIKNGQEFKKTEETLPPASIDSITDPQKSPMLTSGLGTYPTSWNPFNTIESRGCQPITTNKKQVLISTVDSLKLPNRPTTQYTFILALQPVFIFNKIENKAANEIMEEFSEEYKQVILKPGLNISLRLEKRNWMLQSGITYSSYGEDVTYRQNFYVPEYNNLTLQVDTTWGWVYDPPIIGVKWPLSIDSIWSPTYRQITESYTVKNRYHYLEVPVLLGFHSHIRQISYSVSTGVGIGFLIQQSGYLPGGSDPVLQPSDEFKFSTPQFNYILQAGIGIPVKENLQILVEPLIKYSLNSLVNDRDYNYNHRYLSIGLNLGIMLKIK